MNQNSTNLSRTIRLAAGGSLLCLAAAQAVAAQAAVSVAVFADHYVAAGRSFDDLDALEDVLAPARPQRVQLTACGSGTERALRAAAHRFRHAGLELRAADSRAAECQLAAVARTMRVSQTAGPRPTGIYDDAVDRWWNSMQP